MRRADFPSEVGPASAPPAPASARRRGLILRVLLAFLLAAAAVASATVPTMFAGGAEAPMVKPSKSPDRAATSSPLLPLPQLREGWYASWATGLVPPRSRKVKSFANRTLRMTIRTSLGGSAVRIRLANTFGTRPVTFRNVYLGLAGVGSGVERGTNRPVTFRGQRAITIPPGQRIVSDPVTLRVGSGTDLAISVYLPANGVGPVSWHPNARATTYLSLRGDHAADESGARYYFARYSWFFLDGVEVRTRSLGTVVGFGDSLTAGSGSTVDANQRYPDLLAMRFSRAGITRSVVNAGIAGNQLLSHGMARGVSGHSRFVYDALEQAGVTDVILLEGINDIGLHPTIDPDALIAGYRHLIRQAHAKGVRVHGGTLLPYRGASYYTEVGEHTRQVVNQWIRTSGAFDSVIDFDAVLRDPVDSRRLRTAYDSGDHLHPSDAGYQAMANAVDLSLFAGSRLPGVPVR